MKRILLFYLSVFAVMTAKADGDVIEIWTVPQLEVLRNNVNNGTNNYEGKTVKLMTDLNIENDGWVPIGNDTHSFKGTFDGQGYTITLKSTKKHESSTTILGLFGYNLGTIRHLKVGGNINNMFQLTNYTCGIAAINYGTIEKCANLAVITGQTAGGIAGENRGTITNCYNQGNIYGSGASNHYLGGIAGQHIGTISYSYVSCQIEHTNSVGGITANNINGTISNCHFNVKYYSSGSTMDGSETLTGNALNESFGNSVWTFTDGKLPELTCFANKIVRLGDRKNNSSIIEAYKNETHTVELSGRILYKDGEWNTLCLPFDVMLAGSQLVGATARPLVSASISGTTLNLIFGDAVSTLVAGTPYIIKWAKPDPYTKYDGTNAATCSDIVTPTFNSVTISDAKNDYDSNNYPSVPTDLRVRFMGRYNTTTFTGSDYSILMMGDGNKLYYPGNGAGLGAQRAYFKIGDDNTSAPRLTGFNMDFGENTALREKVIVNSEQLATATDGWYTLDGRKLSGKPTKSGVYIYGNKKVYIK